MIKTIKLLQLLQNISFKGGEADNFKSEDYSSNLNQSFRSVIVFHTFLALSEHRRTPAPQ